MSYCSRCGGRVSEGSAFCPSCGFQLLPGDHSRPDMRNPSGQEPDRRKEDRNRSKPASFPSQPDRRDDDRNRSQSESYPTQPTADFPKADAQPAYVPVAEVPVVRSRPKRGLKLTIIGAILFFGAVLISYWITHFGAFNGIVSSVELMGIEIFLFLCMVAGVILSIIGMIKGICTRCVPAIIIGAASITIGILYLFNGLPIRF